MLGIEQKKGRPDFLCGRIIAYARVLPPEQPERKKHSPLDGMVHNGILAVSGDFVRNHGFSEFMRNEFNTSMQEGLSGLMERVKEIGGDMPDGVDQESLRDKMEEFSNMEIIPVPAKVVLYEDEDEILAENADIYYLGEFVGQSQAHLCITSIPIYYQARYREQMARLFQNDINTLLSEVERSSLVTQLPDVSTDPAILNLSGNLDSFQGHLLELLTGQVIPNLVYNTGNSLEYKQSMERFKAFMQPYRFPADITAIEKLLDSMHMGHSDPYDRRRLELLCEKISALHHEEFERLNVIQAELDRLNS